MLLPFLQQRELVDRRLESKAVAPSTISLESVRITTKSVYFKLLFLFDDKTGRFSYFEPGASHSCRGTACISMDESVNGGFCIAPSRSLARGRERDGSWPQSVRFGHFEWCLRPLFYCYSNSSRFYLGINPRSFNVYTIKQTS